MYMYVTKATGQICISSVWVWLDVYEHRKFINRMVINRMVINVGRLLHRKVISVGRLGILTKLHVHQLEHQVCDEKASSMCIFYTHNLHTLQGTHMACTQGTHMACTLQGTHMACTQGTHMACTQGTH